MRFLSNKEIKAMKDVLKKYGINEKRLILYEFDKFEIILSPDKKPLLIKYDNVFVPTLFVNANLPKVIIDLPAVKFIANGADVMRPGIKSMDEFLKNDVVAIIDEKYGKRIAIGIALYDSEEIKSMEKGKVIKNVHYVGDKIYKLKL